MHISMFTCMLCIHVCMHVYMCTCIHVYMYIFIYIYVYICIFVYMYICIYCSVSRRKGGPFSSKIWALFQNILHICDSIPAGIKLAASAAAAASAPGAPAPAAALAALVPPVPAHVLCMCQKGHIYIKKRY